MNKGTKEGTEDEIRFVKLLNKDKKNNYWKVLGVHKDREEKNAIHIINHKYGKINKKMIKSKADVFLATGVVDLNYLIEKDYLLNEKDYFKFNLKYIRGSGISIKRSDSRKYQILKMNPSTFKKVFGSYELGAGASIFCKMENELEKNASVLNGWKTNWEKFNIFFKRGGDLSLVEASKIKRWCISEIHRKIDENETISDFVFKGVGNLEDPFTASWILEKGILKPAGKIPFIVTTGSGRSKGDFTVVIKPRN